MFKTGPYKCDSDFVLALMIPTRASTGRRSESITLIAKPNFMHPKRAPKTWFIGVSDDIFNTPSKNFASKIMMMITAIKTRKNEI